MKSERESVRKREIVVLKGCIDVEREIRKKKCVCECVCEGVCVCVCVCSTRV